MIDIAKILKDHISFLAREGGKRADLRGVDLRGVDLRKANLHSADLSGANLSGADLREVNLSNANLAEARLNSADLSRANLYRTNLSGADLTGADLTSIFNAEVFGLDTVVGIEVLLVDIRTDVTFTLFRWWNKVDQCYKYSAGCHDFTREEALAHWDASDYPSSQRGLRYVRAIEGAE